MSEGAYEPGEPESMRAYALVMIRQGASLLLLCAAALLVVGVDWASAVIALRYLPVPLVAVTGFALGAETAGIWFRFRVPRARREPAGPPWWRLSPRKGGFWLGLGYRVLYSTCLALVAARWIGLGPGWEAGIGVAYTLWCTAVGAALQPASARARALAAFDDPSAPRDTPEI